MLFAKQVRKSDRVFAALEGEPMSPGGNGANVEEALQVLRAYHSVQHPWPSSQSLNLDERSLRQGGLAFERPREDGRLPPEPFVRQHRHRLRVCEQRF